MHYLKSSQATAFTRAPVKLSRAQGRVGPGVDMPLNISSVISAIKPPIRHIRVGQIGVESIIATDSPELRSDLSHLNGSYI